MALEASHGSGGKPHGSGGKPWLWWQAMALVAMVTSGEVQDDFLDH